MNYTHKFCLLESPLSGRNPCNSFLQMRKEILFSCIFTENIYAIMHLEFINSQERKYCVSDVTYGY